MTGTWTRYGLLVVLVTLMVTMTAAPAAAVPSQPDECMNADRGPESDGPPGFVGGLMPDFLGDLFAGLPVPNFVKTFFGAPACG